MKMVIVKKGIVDCTSDSRTHPMQTLQDGIDGAIKILDKEVLELDYASFYLSKTKFNNHLKEYYIREQKDNEIKITDKKICYKLLKNFQNNPEQLSEEESLKIHIHIKVWKFFNDGNNCSDYIDIYSDRLEVSCQDEYDEDERLIFHENIEELLSEQYAIAIDDNLISLHISATEKCQTNCNTCYVNRGLQRDLEKEDWVNLPLSEQYAIGGGEPAEYPLISELVDYLKKQRNGYVAVTTNGQKIINFNQLPDKIAVSIDGLTQEEHSRTHNTHLKNVLSTIKYYKSKIKANNICINHIVHRENIDNVKNFIKLWTDKGHEVNLILFIGEDNLKPTLEQLYKFKEYFDKLNDKRMSIDSCMSGLLNMLDSITKNYLCQQGLYSKYYRFGAISPCSHSAIPYPHCSTIEDYMKYFFKTLRPIIFIYEKDATSGSHEWASKAGFRGKIRHKIDTPLRKDIIYILTNDEADTIKEQHYLVFFENKMPYWLSHRNKQKYK